MATTKPSGAIRLLQFCGIGIALVALVVVLLSALLQTISVRSFFPTAPGAPAVGSAALALQQRVWGPAANLYDPNDALIRKVIPYWLTYCNNGSGGLCHQAAIGNLQCVQFVTAAYFLAGDPLPAVYNAEDFWTGYAGRSGWQRIPSPSAFPVAFAPPTLGDLIIWKGGGHWEAQLLPNGQVVQVWAEWGHIAIVVGYHPPTLDQNGTIEVAQANASGNKFADTSARGNTYTMQVTSNGVIKTWAGFWVLGFLRHSITPSGLSLPSGLSFDNPFVKYAYEQARQAQISPGVFIRQINQESGFNPNAVSSAGAVGIAQFMPETAAGLGIDPRNPYAALRAAALYMQQKLQRYGGDYAKALASYNAGDGGVADAIAAAMAAGLPQNWRKFLPAETQRYVLAILGT
jgi:hypothetical protein